MSMLELLIIAIGLSMDAFAVAVCKGTVRFCRQPQRRSFDPSRTDGHYWRLVRLFSGTDAVGRLFARRTV